MSLKKQKPTHHRPNQQSVCDELRDNPGTSGWRQRLPQGTTMSPGRVVKAENNLLFFFLFFISLDQFWSDRWSLLVLRWMAASSSAPS